MDHEEKIEVEENCLTKNRMYNFPDQEGSFLLLVKSGFEIQMNVVITLEIFS